MRVRIRTGVLWAGLAAVVSAADPLRIAPVIDPAYDGAHAAAYTSAIDQVRWMTRVAQQEVSVGLGLIRYQEGFRYPVRLRFEDSGMPGAENLLAYVSLGTTSGGFAQELVINVTAIGQPLPPWADFRTIFTHEMTHAVLNDSVGGDASMRLPRWVHEGLAQWISKEGEGRLKGLDRAYTKSQIRQTPMDLENPPPALAYPLYYLGIRGLEARHGINAVQALVRLLIEGHPTQDALLESTGQPAERFYEEAERYARETLLDLARADGSIPGLGL